MSSIPTSMQAKAKAAYTAAQQLGVFTVQDHYQAKAPGFMDLHIERIRDDYSCGPFEAWSICHYFEQNGDLCQDPEMLLLADHQRRQLYPAWFQMAIPPVFRRSIEQVSATGLSYRPKELLDQQNFLAMWLHNIRAQGFKVTA